MANEAAIAAAVARTRHKTEQVRRMLREAGIGTQAEVLGGRKLPAWVGEGIRCSVAGDPLPYLEDGEGVSCRVDAAWYAAVAADQADPAAAVSGECDRVIACLESLVP